MAYKDVLAAPAAASGLLTATEQDAWANSDWVEIIANTSTDIAIIRIQSSSTPGGSALDSIRESELCIGVGAVGAEVEKVVIPATFQIDSAIDHFKLDLLLTLPEPYIVRVGQRVAVRTRINTTTSFGNGFFKLMYQEIGIQFVDTGTAALVLTPSSADVKDSVDSATVPLTITVSAVEDYQAAGGVETVDSGTVTLTLTPSGSDVKESVDATTVSLVITPSSVDVKDSVDSATVGYTLTPSGVDIRIGSAEDIGTVTLAITPSLVEGPTKTWSNMLSLTTGTDQHGAIVAQGRYVHAAYRNGTTIRYRRSDDHGHSYTAEQTIVASGVQEVPLTTAMCVDGLNVHLFYEKNNNLYHISSTDRGVTWSTETQIDTAPSSAWFYRVASIFIEGEVHVAFSRHNNTGTPLISSGIFYRRFIGGTWQTVQQASDPSAQNPGRPGISYTGNMIFVTWEDERDEIPNPGYGSNSNNFEFSPQIYLARSIDRGSSFEADEALTSGSGGMRFRPDVVAVGRYVTVVWQDDGAVNGQEELYRVLSSDYGVTFGAPVKITSGIAPSEHVQIRAYQSTIMLVWVDYRSGAAVLWFSLSRDAGLTWTPEEKTVHSFSSPRLAMTDDIAIVFDQNNANNQMSVTRYGFDVADPVQVLVDDFNRADDAVPPPGTDYSNGVTTFVAGDGLAISSNQLVRRSTGGYRQGATYTPATFGPDFDLVFEISGVPDTNLDGIYAYARLANIGSGSTDGYALALERVSSTTYGFNLWRVDNGVTTLINPNVGALPLVAVGDLIAFTGRGSLLRTFLKKPGGSWNTVSEATDTTYTGGGNVGFEFVRNQSGKITNLWVDTILVGSDLETVVLTITPSATTVQSYPDSGTVPVALTPSGVDEYFPVLTPTVDAGTVNFVITPSTSVESVELEDANTVRLALTPNSTDTSQRVDTSTIYVDLGTTGTDIYTSASNEDAAVVYFKITPATFFETRFVFDTLLVGALRRTWSGSLETRRWDGTLTRRWSGILITQRWSGSLRTRLWSGNISRRWSGVLGRK